ncbi:YkuS family protein [Planococcus sp. CAU13]|uniref:YkuS family protein n=1 Tax=Planococcus sp. CAU13 TaxID=1541197 RepID=UPI00052FE993|nr:YkuS family protein [Planococcus sp. CAU13]
MVKIAVEEPFTSVQQALVSKGYKAKMLENKTDATSYDCIVVRDKEDFADFHMNVPLVEAKGRTLFEIVEEVEERLVRSGKIMPPTPIVSENKSGGGGGGFIAGAATGALIGAAAGLMLAPKSGKELQQTVKDKAAEMKEKKEEKAKSDSGENSGGGKLDQVKEKLGPLKEKASGVTEKAKGKADELKAKREEKKEEKELMKQQKEVAKSMKEEEKAKKDHEKAVKKAQKEEKKAEKEAKQESGGIEVVEFGASTVEKKDSGEVNIHPAGKDNK